VALAVCLLAIGVVSVAAAATLDCNQQATSSRPIDLGISGGNINSSIKLRHQKGCFSGTLGSMVQDSGGHQFILSNNHVLADINKAKPGELIVQPGRVDTAPVCLKSRSDAVATFSRAVKIKFGGGTNTIDAAIAAVEPGRVSPYILNIGEIASSVVAPMVGVNVQKMGRTSCFTTGTIEALGFNATVNYAEGNGVRLAKFVNQILITGSTVTPAFALPGDSGSLIVTQEACPQAVALLFAGASDGSYTVANPISDVLSGLNVSMTGSCTPPAASDIALAGDIGMSKEAVQSGVAVRDRHEHELMSIPGAVGTGIGISDQPGQPAIEVYLKKLTPQAQAAAPKEVEGMPVKLIQSGSFVAY
jgi:hypothetical protein